MGVSYSTKRCKKSERRFGGEKRGFVGGLVSTVRRNSVPTRGFCGACSGDLGLYVGFIPGLVATFRFGNVLLTLTLFAMILFLPLELHYLSTYL